MERHHKRAKRSPGFNIISLMDIFTILVFFLLVNSADVQDLANPRAITLPESSAESKPRQTVVVMVTGNEVLVQGEPVTTLDEALASPGTILPLMTALQAQAGRALLQGEDPLADARREVTIMGDKEIPFRLLKKIMTSCTEAGYASISLAVMQRTPAET
jgi:biopolymer transport protein ExbD